MIVNVSPAKAQFSKLLRRVQAGEEITIARAGVPVARLVPFRKGPKICKLGAGRGTFQMSNDFDAPLGFDF